MDQLSSIFQSVMPIELGMLLAAVVLHHLFIRAILRRCTKSLREQEQIAERVKQRIAELEPFSTVVERANTTMRIHEEEGTSPRPALTFLAALLALFMVAFFGVSAALWSIDGPLAENIWWFGPAYVAVRFALNLVRSYLESEDPGLGVYMGAALAGGFIMTGFAMIYAFLPVGTIVFLFLSSIFGGIAWRIAPPKPDNLPPIAMLFM